MKLIGLMCAALLISTAAFARPDNTLGVAIMSARILNDGTLLVGSGVNGNALRPSTGTYQVFFDRDVATCIYAATSYYSGRTAAAEGLAGAADGVLILMSDSAGAPIDGGFDLLVYCAQ